MLKKNINFINKFLFKGGSLSSLIKHFGKLNEKVVRRYTKDILKGLEYLHVNNIIHRDIKGANILVDNNGKCKLADFGSAKEIFNSTGDTL